MRKLNCISDGVFYTALTMEEIEDLRNKLMVLSAQGFHPRYAEPIDQMLNAAVAILVQMQADEAKLDQCVQPQNEEE